MGSAERNPLEPPAQEVEKSKARPLEDEIAGLRLAHTVIWLTRDYIPGG